MTDFGRMMTAMVTPFDQSLELDLSLVPKLVDHLINTGTDTIVVSGTTGESPTLSKKEKLLLIEEVIKATNKRIKVIAGTGGNNTNDSIEFTKEVTKLAVDGIMVVAPYYNKPSQEGIYKHFISIADTSNLPLMIYNIPGRTGINITVDTILKLAEHPNIFSVKEASGDITQMGEIIANKPKDFLLYSGDDKLTLPVLSIGGHGIVSVASHIIGNEIKEMMQLYLNGEIKKAADYHSKLLELFEGIFYAPNPVPIKFLLNEIGINVGGVRLPLVDMNEQLKEKVLNIYKKAIQ